MDCPHPKQKMCLNCYDEERFRDLHVQIDKLKWELGEAQAFARAHDAERARAVALDLQVSELKTLLRTIKEQGLAHQCSLEGHIDKYGCADCKANTEARIDAAIGIAAEKRISDQEENRRETGGNPASLI